MGNEAAPFATPGDPAYGLWECRRMPRERMPRERMPRERMPLDRCLRMQRDRCLRMPLDCFLPTLAFSSALSKLL